MRVPGLALAGLAVACSHSPPVEEPVPLQSYVCTGRARPPWAEAREGPGGPTQPFRLTVPAQSPGQAIAAITADQREQWNYYFRNQNWNQRTPPFPGLIGASCVAEVQPDTTPAPPQR